MKSILGSFRVSHTTIYHIREEMPKSGKAAACGVMSCRISDPSGGKAVMLAMPALAITFYEALGHITARWSILELHIDEMTKLLTRVTGGDPDMRGIYNAKRRIAYHEEQFALAFSSHPAILKYHHEIMKIVKRVKRVRDFVGHAQIVGQPTPKGFTVRFIDPTVKGLKEYPYTFDDLMKVASEISHAAGWLEALALGDSFVLPFAFDDISALQHVLGGDRWNAAICRALKVQPQSSRM